VRKLENFYQIPENRSGSQPITVEVIGNLIRITAVFRYNRRALEPWQDSNVSQADLIEAAIIRYWSGHYRLRSDRFRGYIKAKVEVKIFRQLIGDELYSCDAVLIKVRPLMLMPAHVISPWYRRLWGIFRTGQWESLGTNWSPCCPGIMVLPPANIRFLNWFERMSAHEAGHLFGLGDAYGALYRYYYAAPGTRNYMMHSNRRVQPREITMLLEAHMSGKMQFFPKKWQKGTFASGFKREIEHRTRELERKLSRRN
jgi:hypothetical protein